MLHASLPAAAAATSGTCNAAQFNECLDNTDKNDNACRIKAGGKECGVRAVGALLARQRHGCCSPSERASTPTCALTTLIRSSRGPQNCQGKGAYACPPGYLCIKGERGDHRCTCDDTACGALGKACNAVSGKCQ